MVFCDAIHFKVRQEDRAVTHAAYVVVGIKLESYIKMSSVFGIGERESAKFWLTFLSARKTLGVQDILVVAA